LRKQRLSILIVLLLFLIIPEYYASASQDNDNFLDIGLMLSNYNYKEIDIDGTTLDSETGALPGAELTFSHQPSNSNLFLRGSSNISTGNLTYNGANCNLDTNRCTPISFSHPNTFFNIEGDIGFFLGENKTFVLYSGIGHTYWYRGTSGGPGDYSETYTLYYFPTGIIVNIIPSKVINISIDASLRSMFSGKVTAYFSQSYPSENDVALTLGNTTGGVIKVSMIYLFNKDFSLLITPWYESSSNGISNLGILTDKSTGSSYYMQEPNSNTNKYGLNLGIRVEL